ncbi:MAG: SAF domain-containing protein [Myxococcaceae bacterium]|nr:SAF domain-containing protein [Myxococcaceae bacterium]
MKSLPFALAGVLLGVSVSGALGISAGLEKMRAARQGWQLVPVVVAAVDLKAGDVVSMEVISQRAIPEQFVGPSMVRPDEASFIVDRRLTTPLLAGDAVLWASFLDPPWASAFSACVTHVKPLVDARATEVEPPRLDAVKANARSFDGPPPALDVPPDGRVVTVRRTLHEGDVLQDSDLAVVTVPPLLRVVSLVPASERPLVVGARLLVELEPGDLLRWQMLDDAEAPSTVAGCEATVGLDLAAARTEAARAAAKQWVDRQHQPKDTP